MNKIRSVYILAFILTLVLTSCLPGRRQTPVSTSTMPAKEISTPGPQDDWAVVRSSGVLRIGTAADYPPFTYFDETGQIIGFDIALIKELANRLGVNTEITDFAFDGLLDAQALDQIDASIGAISITPERLNRVDFTNLYYAGSDGILARVDSPIGSVKSIADMAGQRIAVQRGTVYEQWVKTNLVDPGTITSDQLFSYDMVQNAVRDLRQSRVDLVILDLIPAQREAENGVYLVGQGLFPQQYAIALRKGSTLTAELNRVLAEAGADGTLNQLVEKYLKVETRSSEPTPLPPTPAPVLATPTSPDCIHGMAYVADLSFDDQNMTRPPILQPGQSFTKSWRIRNTGTCNWNPNFFLRFVRGNVPAAQMNGQPVPIPQIVAPGFTTDISVNLIAPASPGTYQGFWQMTAPNGTFFGQTIWVGITVPGAAPTAPSQPFINSFIASPVNILTGQCTQLMWDAAGNISRVELLRNDGLLWRNAPSFGNFSDCLANAGLYTYRLNVIGLGGTTWALAQVQVTPGQPPPPVNPVIYEFYANPSQVQIGQCTMLYWNTASATSIQLLSNNVPIANNLPASGSLSDCPNRTGPLTYTLAARNSIGEVQQNFLIYVDDSGISPQ